MTAKLDTHTHTARWNIGNLTSAELCSSIREKKSANLLNRSIMNRYEGVSHLENPACIGHRFKGEFSALPSDRRYPPPHFLALYPSGSLSPRVLSSPIFAFCILETADFLTGLGWICPIYCLLDLPSPLAMKPPRFSRPKLPIEMQKKTRINPSSRITLRIKTDKSKANFLFSMNKIEILFFFSKNKIHFFSTCYTWNNSNNNNNNNK